MSLEQEIEALTKSIENNGSEDDKINFVFEFTNKFFSELGFAFSFNGAKNDVNGVKVIGNGHLTKAHKLSDEVELMLSSSRILVEIISNPDADLSMAMSLVRGVNDLIESNMGEQIPSLIKSMPKEIRDAMLRSLTQEEEDEDDDDYK